MAAYVIMGSSHVAGLDIPAYGSLYFFYPLGGSKF